MASRDRRRFQSIDAQAGSVDNRSWLTHEIEGKGSPAGSYVMGFFCLVTITLTGFEGAYSLPAWAALALTAAWAFANARYPVEEEPGTEQ
jgi:hypothetical protein